MENGEDTVDCNPILLPSFCLSPESEDSSRNMADNQPDLIHFPVYANEIYSADPLSHLDFLTMVLPPTPEDSGTRDVDIEHSQDAALLEEIYKESNTVQKITSSENLLGCISGEDKSLRSGSKQMSEAGTKLMPPAGCQLPSAYTSQTTMQFEKLPGFLEKTCEPSGLDLLASQHSLEALTGMNTHNITLDENDSQSKALVDTTSQQKDKVSELSSAKETDQCTNARKEKKAKNALKFPPCIICMGTATGSHYGAITCEACKGFFRRYLQKKTEYKCTKGGNCEIKSCNRGNLNCSGCRLKKCLTFGMSKEKSRMGRYTLTKRTEAIINMNKREGKEVNDTATAVEGSEMSPVVNETDISSCNPDKELLKAHVIQNVRNLNRSNGFNDALVSELMEALDAIQPYGPDIITEEQITEAHKLHSERYQRKQEIFGPMKCVSRDEYNKLYQEFGIDIDERMADMKLHCQDMEGYLERYYNFAKHIPGFYCIPVHDQVKLLKFSMDDFYTIVAMEGYSEEHQTFISFKWGRHFEEVADREYSRKCWTIVRDTFRRWQALALSKNEKALVAALTLVSTDRCKLNNSGAVERIQLALTDLLQSQLQKHCHGTAGRRLTKIIDTLTLNRDMLELTAKESNILFKDDLMRREFPFMGEFLLEEND